MPTFRHYYATREAAADASAAAIANIEAQLFARNALDPLVGASTAQSAAPTSQLTVIAVAALPAGALLTTAAPVYRVTYELTTADLRPARFVAQFSGTPPNVGDTSYVTTGDPLLWQTRTTRTPDGRWAVDIFTLPEGT